MKSKFVKRHTSDRLIIIFAGWGMDWRPFANLSHPGYDIMVIWDYRDTSFNWKAALRYEEICVVAWSMGVFAASITMHEILPRVTMRIAVNGTLQPIDDRYGIPPAIWHGTHNALSPSTWRKFQRRMCSSATQFAEFSENAPKRTLSDLIEELEALETHTLFHTEQITEWDMAIIGTSDAIFPADNQKRAWEKLAPIRLLDNPHLPDFVQLINRLIIDKDLVRRRFAEAGSTYVKAATIQRNIALGLMKRFNTIFNEEIIVGNIVEIGPGVNGFLTKRWISRTDPRAKIMLWDLIPVSTGEYPSNTVSECCDAEIRIKRQPSESVRFIFSSSTFQWFNSIRDFLNECSRILIPGGYLAFSSFVRGNMDEVASIIGKGLQLPSMSGWASIVPEDMEVLECSTETYTLDFDSPRNVLEHLRDTGVNGVVFGKSSAVMARKLLREYPRDSETGKYRLTFLPIYIIARKKTDTLI